MMKLKSIYIFFLLTIPMLVWGQEKEQTIQPTIMVVPFSKEGQSVRSAYENNELNRIAITKTKEAFDKRGVNTIDLIAKLKQTNNNAAMQENSQIETADEVIRLSGADIYVVVEASRNYSQSGNSANVILTAYDAFSGESLANKTSASPKIYTENYEKLVEKAVEKEIDNLLNTIQEKFTKIIDEGRSLVINISLSEEATIALDDEVNDEGDYLSDVIEDYIHDQSFNNQYHLQGITGNSMIFDLVKVPLFDDKGRNFRVSKFASRFRKFLKKQGVGAEQVIQGSNIVFTLRDLE